MVESRPHLALPAARAQARDSLVPSLSSVRQWAFMGEAAAFQGSSCRAVGIQSPASWGVGAERWLHSCLYSSESSAMVLALVLATWSSMKLVKMDSTFCSSEY